MDVFLKREVEVEFEVGIVVGVAAGVPLLLIALRRCPLAGSSPAIWDPKL